ncbi:4-hydroxy-tetrahydrodipicolinate synthase [Lactobacillus crispatus]|uniref:4-hydroxy-tetrahydrodipicolinate synthase n=1 Tax=Lactobacillus crispatus TaxID=47770 RepID=A0AAW4DR27_9LACO|nr:4-hydroxy-tetrahydrodipicolinate synthase [Lactobacillus crispatus]MBI1708446.1 4-hydroxy-tetrahydrodipicolinate synthase [Lactobacillus crispatus]
MSKAEIAHGIIAAMVTPMDEDGNINFDELRNQVDRQINAGISGVFTLGTNGEGYILNHDEKLKVMKAVIEEADHRVPVYVGTGCVSTEETIELSMQAEDLGADALSVITPWFAKASQEDLYEHYKKLNDHVHIPILLYNIPARTGNALAPQTVARLADLPNIKGVKDSSGNFDNILQYIELTRGKDFNVISGNDSLILWTLKAGGTGGIAACANVLPDIMVSIYKYYEDGDWDAARKAQDSIRPFRNCFKLGNPNTIVKKATNLMGYPVGMPRAPFNGLTKEAVETIQKTLDTYYSQYKK